MTKLRALAIAAPAGLLMAAAPAPYSTDDAGFGSTVDAMISAQAIDMTPEYAGVPMEGSNGKRSADAYRRYLSGNVKKLLSVTGKAEVGSQGGAVEQIITAPQPNQ
jgi:hypothetical protein